MIILLFSRFYEYLFYTQLATLLTLTYNKSSGVIMLLKLYFQTVFIFAKYFPIVTLPLYVFGAWAFSALLFYMAWDMGFEPDDNGAAQQHIMKETFATVVHQGLIVG